jgi:hypothetical protein
MDVEFPEWFLAEEEMTAKMLSFWAIASSSLFRTTAPEKSARQ